MDAVLLMLFLYEVFGPLVGWVSALVLAFYIVLHLVTLLLAGLPSGKAQIGDGSD